MQGFHTFHQILHIPENKIFFSPIDHFPDYTMEGGCSRQSSGDFQKSGIAVYEWRVALGDSGVCASSVPFWADRDSHPDRAASSEAFHTISARPELP